MSAAPASAARRARLGRYAAWQLRDYALERGLLVLVIGGFLVWALNPTLSADALPRGPERAMRLALAVDLVLRSFGPLAVLVSVNAIVAADRQYGYFRLLFAKPVSVWRYYAQRFAVWGLAYAVLAILVVAMLAASFRVALPWPVYAVAVGYYVAVGGIIFLGSTITRFDWVFFGVFWAGALVLHALEQGHGWRWAGIAAHALPPAWRVPEILRAAALEEPLPVGAALWLLGYGAACFLLGLLVVRRRPMSV